MSKISVLDVYNTSTVILLKALDSGPKTYKQLERSLPYSSATITIRLRQLRERKFIEKEVREDNYGHKVELWKLTDKGKELLEVLRRAEILWFGKEVLNPATEREK